MLRLERCDWRYFDQLFVAASPVNEVGCSKVLSFHATELWSPNSPKRIVAVHWGRDEKLLALAVWRAWKGRVRHRRRMQKNVTWLTQRRAFCSWRHWRAYVASRRRKQVRVHASLTALSNQLTATQTRTAWYAWRRRLFVECHLRQLALHRQLAVKKASWQHWHQRLRAWQTRSLQLAIAREWHLRALWRRWKRGCSVHQNHQRICRYMGYWRLQQQLSTWHAWTRASHQQAARSASWRERRVLHLVRASFRAWCHAHDRRRQNVRARQERRRRQLRDRFRRWRILVANRQSSRRRHRVACSHHAMRLRQRVWHHWREYVTAWDAIHQLCHRLHLRSIKRTAMLAWRQLMARKEAQIIALLSLRLRQGIARWRERHHARRYVAHQASLVLSAQLQRRKLVWWRSWRSCFSSRLLLHVATQHAARSLQTSCFRRWGTLCWVLYSRRVEAERALEQHLLRCRARHFTAWRQRLVRKQELVEIGQWLQHKAATTRHRRILHHWYGHCVAQQLQQVSRMRAVAHHRRRLSRQLPVVVFQWRSWTLDAVAVQALRAATIEAHHRFHQRRAMLKAWQCVCRIARRARAWNDARLWRQCRHMLQAWRVLVRRQMYISSVVHLFENARFKGILQTTLHQWRTATAQLCSRRRSIDCFQFRRVRQAQDRVLRVWRCWVACRHHARNQALQCALHGERQRARSTWGTWRSRYRVISDRRQAIAALMQHHTRARLLRQFVNWQLWAAQRRHWQRCLDTRLHASWLLRTHFGAWSDHVDRRRFLASGVASLHTTWRHRQTRQVWCRWQKHRDELEATLSPATAVCQKAQRRKAWVHWRQAWHQRRAAHDAHLHVLRDALRGLWRQWHRYCLLQHEARTLVDQALDMASKHRKCRAWRRWLRYHAAKVAQRLWLARSTRHYLGFHCRIAIQKLSAHAYLSRLQVAVSRGGLRRSFAAWQRLVSELTMTRRRARQALFHMQHWRIRRGWCQWRLGHLRAHRQHHQEDLSTRQYVRHRLANGLGRWLCMLREKQQRRVRWLLADAHCSKRVLGMAWASWRRATALRKRGQQQFHCARQFAATRCLLRMWQHWHLWYRYRRTSTFRVMAVTRRRQHVWFRSWQRVANARHLARLHQTRRLGRLFTAWYDQTRYVLACRVQLAVAYDRLSLAAHWSHWRATIARTRRIHRLVQARWDHTCARVLHGWYQVLTSRMLGQYHAQRRWQTKLMMILHRWHRRASVAQLIARSQRRRRQVVFGRWISHTCVRQAVRVMQHKREHRHLTILLVTWQRTALLAQCRRRALRKSKHRVWCRWRRFVEQRKLHAQWHRQLWVVLENDYGSRPAMRTGSQAYRQSAQLLHEARTRRHLMLAIVTAWRRLLPVAPLVTLPRHRRQNAP